MARALTCQKHCFMQVKLQIFTGRGSKGLAKRAALYSKMA